jgi:hypothetical protein
MHDLLIPLLIKFRSENDILSDCFILNPRFLSGIRDTALTRKVVPRVRTSRDVMHLAKKCHEKTSFSTASWSNDEINNTVLELELFFNGKAELALRWCKPTIVASIIRPSERSTVESNVGICADIRRRCNQWLVFILLGVAIQ